MDLSELTWRAKKAFEYADTEQIGSLTRYQYKVAVTAVFGCPPDKSEVNSLMESCVGKRIMYDEFESWVFKNCSSLSLAMSLEYVFSLLDKKSNGYLTLNDLCKAGQLAQLRTSSAVWQKVFHSLDKQRKGYVDLYEFVQLLNNTANRH